jgi:hypothetical protein
MSKPMWVRDRRLSTRWTIYHLYHGENEQVFLWDDDGICFVIDRNGELDFYHASSLMQYHAYTWKINMTLYSDKLS